MDRMRKLTIKSYKYLHKLNKANFDKIMNDNDLGLA